jgi:hypothetical protein
MGSDIGMDLEDKKALDTAYIRTHDRTANIGVESDSVARKRIDPVV